MAIDSLISSSGSKRLKIWISPWPDAHAPIAFLEQLPIKLRKCLYNVVLRAQELVALTCFQTVFDLSAYLPLTNERIQPRAGSARFIVLRMKFSLRSFFERP